jgi:hypothetical protein
VYFVGPRIYQYQEAGKTPKKDRTETEEEGRASGDEIDPEV